MSSDASDDWLSKRLDTWTKRIGAAAALITALGGLWVALEKFPALGPDGKPEGGKAETDQLSLRPEIDALREELEEWSKD